MKNINSLRLIFTLLFVAVTRIALAQSGPSDGTSAPPPTGTADKVICSSQGISINGPQNAGVDYPAYQWYKLDASGVAHLTTVTTRNYTETPSGTGYYSYQLVTVNSNGCTSPMSDVYKIYVLPPVTATITTSISSNTICSNNQSSILLTATPSNPTAYTYTYQWTRNGVNITGATNNTYTLSETNSGSVSMGVIVSYTLSSGCSATATQSITVDPIPTKPTIIP
jgi:hypothetical protein